MKHVIKTFKADTDVGQGQGHFTALVSTFGTVDSQDDQLEAGAFTEGLKAFSKDRPLPVLWDHKWGDIWAHIGLATAEQTDDGLIIDAQLDLDNPTAAQAYKLMSQGRVCEFSIGGFEPPDGITIDSDGVAHISRFDLTEVSLTLKGANPDTRLLDIKSQDAAAQAPNEDDTDAVTLTPDQVSSLKEAIAHITDAVSQMGDTLASAGDPDEPTDQDSNQDQDTDTSTPADASADGADESASKTIAAAQIALAQICGGMYE